MRCASINNFNFSGGKCLIWSSIGKGEEVGATPSHPVSFGSWGATPCHAVSSVSPNVGLIHPMLVGDHANSFDVQFARLGIDADNFLSFVEVA